MNMRQNKIRSREYLQRCQFRVTTRWLFGSS